MESYHGHTHNSLRVRSSYARYFNVEMTFPFIQEYSETNNLEAVLTHYASQLPDSESFHIIAWSNSVPLVLEVLGKHDLPVEHVALLGSFLEDKPTQRFTTIQKIKQRNPNINWHIWHGEEDERVPISTMERWVEAFESQGFPVRYERLPLTDHEVYFTDPRKKFYRYLTQQ